jgi:hypothetical protein
MKIRTGFVSNSSSSSFICDISGRTESGMDMCMSDAQMVESKWGMYGEKYVIGGLDNAKKTVYVKQHEEDEIELEEGWEERGEWEDVEEWRWAIPNECCPLYNLVEFTNKTLLNCLIKKSGRTLDEFKQLLRNEFGNLENLTKWLTTKE